MTNDRPRYVFIDNLRWVIVVLVLIYHVFYNFNAVGVFGGIGGLQEQQWQDVICTALNPWFMTLMFVLAGASSRYALMRRSPREFRKERTHKLLVPATLGLLIQGAALGYVNMRASGTTLPAEMPFVVRYLIAAISGTGALWFIQDLFLFSLLLLALRKRVNEERIEDCLSKCSETKLLCILCLLYPLLWALSQTQIDNVGTFDGLLNLYRPIYYFVVFLVGYYIFSSEHIHNLLERRYGWFLGAMVVFGVIFCTKFYGMDYTSPIAVQSPWCNFYCASAALALMGAFKRWYNHTSPFAAYMTRSSYGLYIVHMVVCTTSCLLLKGTALPVWSIYGLALTATFIGSVVLWELLRRVPLIRWCVFGIRERGTANNVL